MTGRSALVSIVIIGAVRVSLDTWMCTEWTHTQSVGTGAVVQYTLLEPSFVTKGQHNSGG